MLRQLPSLHRFQPDFYVGGTERFYLPLVYDLLALGKPARVVTIGLGDGEIYFAACQAAEEFCPGATITVTRVQDDGPEADDAAWQNARAYGEEFYGETAVFIDAPAEQSAAAFSDGSIDHFVLNDSASPEAARHEFESWMPKLARNAVILVHGIHGEGFSGARGIWREIRDASSIEFAGGLGMGVAFLQPAVEATDSVPQAFSELAAFSESLPLLYELAAARMAAQARASSLEKENRELQLRQIWIPSLLEDRLSMQATIDHLAAHTEHLDRHIAHITRVHEWDAGQARIAQQSLEAEMAAARSKLDTQQQQLQEQKRLVKAAKLACGRRGRCFQFPASSDEPKKPVPLRQKLGRELARIARQLVPKREAHAEVVASPAVADPAPRASEPGSAEPNVAARELSRYDLWFAEHEPSDAELEQQREKAKKLTGPLISLVVPVYNTPPHLLMEMIASVTAQTYANWELCVVDAASDSATAAVLAKWSAVEPRLRVERLDRNYGIAENTNRTLRLASGEFVALLDHDDLLAPFALFEVARAIAATPGADIFYSDEDRWSENGQRHAPFFKPEWSPELLYSCMYIGHLTVYRRSLLDELGGFRSEFDLSQDYDLALRATERTDRIIHIPQVLYHWREHAASSSIGGKPEARRTNLAALDAAIRRRGFDAEVIEYPTANRVRMKLREKPRVSIIIPTDSLERAIACSVELPRATGYEECEIVIVTKSQLAQTIGKHSGRGETVRTVAYDAPFNFSDKCNAGARAATGDTLIFLNDDVAPLQGDWIENLIEPLENPAIGAVAPKMLYADGRIQHAGLVTGVRNLIGTAFHLLRGDSTEHVNFAQSMRDVSALSGACLAIRRSNFVDAGGFDSEHLPIFHSDIDLCFKLRERGLRCVYTPFAVMRHLGHASLSEHEKGAPPAKDKSDIYLLKRWAGYTAHDPYFPTNMRDWLYRDSPTPVRIAGVNDPARDRTIRDVLVVAANVGSGSDGDRLHELASAATSVGDFVVVIAASGELGDEHLTDAHIPLIVDPLVLQDDGSFAKFCGNFDLLAVATPGCEAAARVARLQNVPVEDWTAPTGTDYSPVSTEQSVR